MKSCFISAPVNVDLGVLRSVLASKGMQTILPFELEIAGGNFRGQIEKAIRKASFVVAVLTRETSANVYFELGYAWANEKRIVLIQTEDFDLPLNVSEFAVLKAKASDRQQLSRALDDVLKQPRPPKSREGHVARTRPLSTQARELTQHLERLHTRATHQELENILTVAFRDSGIEVLAQPQEQGGYDFALWLDELNHLVGNPLLVEAKVQLSKPEAIDLKKRFIEHFGTEVGRALLVVFLKGPEQLITLENSGVPLVLFVPAARLISELEQRSLADYIRAQRNRLVHGV